MGGGMFWVGVSESTFFKSGWRWVGVGRGIFWVGGVVNRFSMTQNIYHLQ